jgi:hypothetical protein
MSFFNKIKETINRGAKWGRKAVHDVSNFGHKVSGVAHQVMKVVNTVADSEIGNLALNLIPGGGEVRQAIQVGNKALKYGDEGLSFVDRVDTGLDKVTDLQTGLAFGKTLKDDSYVRDTAKTIQKVRKDRADRASAPPVAPSSRAVMGRSGRRRR